MKKIYLIVCGLMMLTSIAYAEARFENEEFSIQGFASEKSNSTYMALSMGLPQTEAFSPNVNVQIQPFTGTLEQYMILSSNQIKQAKLNLISAKQNNGFLVFEYEGKMGGKNLHWYAKACLRDDKIYLTTATCTKGQWPEYKDRLVNCVNSFELK